MSSTTTTRSVDAIVQEITIKASASRVFEALVDPAQRMKWWGQKGRFETTNVESDLRPGGRWLMSGTGMGRPFQSRRRLSDHRTSARTRLHLAAVLGRRWDRGTGAVRFG